MTEDAGLAVARELIPARIRRGLYAAASLLGYALAAVVVGITAAGIAVPAPVTVALAVLGSLMGPLGQLAAVNTTNATPLPLDEPDGPGV